MEAIDQCVMLDGDHVIAVNPAPPNELEYLHTTLSVLIRHHKGHGFHTFVVNHIWQTPEELADCRRSLCDLDTDIRCFLLELPLDENLRRIQRRQAARALDEREFEMQTVMEERGALFAAAYGDLGERLDVSASPEALVAALLPRLGLR